MPVLDRFPVVDWQHPEVSAAAPYLSHIFGKVRVKANRGADSALVRRNDWQATFPGHHDALFPSRHRTTLLIRKHRFSGWIHQHHFVLEFERILGCPVDVNAGWSGVRVARHKWNASLRRRDPVLRTILERQANDVVAKLPESRDVVSELSRLLESQVAKGDTGIDAVARKLGLSPRTLQRRLTFEGKTYQLLLDDARKTLAGQHVSETRLAICEVAFLLGYSEPAAFHRAFKRWYGMTPQSFRTLPHAKWPRARRAP